MNRLILKIELLHCVLVIIAGVVLTLIGLILNRKHRTNTSKDDSNWYHDQSMKMVISGIAILLLGVAGLRFLADGR